MKTKRLWCSLFSLMSVGECFQHFCCHGISACFLWFGAQSSAPAAAKEEPTSQQHLVQMLRKRGPCEDCEVASYDLLRSMVPNGYGWF